MSNQEWLTRYCKNPTNIANVVDAVAERDATIAQLRAQLATERDEMDGMSAHICQLEDTVRGLLRDIERRDIKVRVMLGENEAMTRTLREERAQHRDDIARLRMELAEAHDDDAE